MKILMVNKFLHPNGGSETYVFRLGNYLIEQGHEVQYFGMEHPNRCVSNKEEMYTSNMDFHEGSIFQKLSYPMKTIYSLEARKKIRKVLNSFKPEVVHLNNFNYQLTPSIILEIKKWSKKNRHKCNIIYTAHDYQLVCPNHMLKNIISHENCMKCLNGNFYHCVKNRCIHKSLLKSIIGFFEAYFWNKVGVYNNIDTVICCSGFMKKTLDRNRVFRNKTVVLLNFIEEFELEFSEKENYVLYFGRYSKEKGINTLLNVCDKLPEISFVFAGSGPLEEQVDAHKNVKNYGFLTGETLKKTIAKAKFAIYPSEWYENCPFSVMESIMCRTPVIGAKIGGIPELINEGVTGELFESGNEKELAAKIKKLWNNEDLLEMYTDNCGKAKFVTINDYYKEVVKIYAR